MVRISINSQAGRIVRALSDGRWHTVANIHRAAGTCRLNSRISELRTRGFVIEHDTVPGRSGSLGHRYRMVKAPLDISFVGVPPERPALSRDEVPRDIAHRYRIYRRVFGELELVAAVPTPERVGVELIRLGLEGQFAESCPGILDTHASDAVSGTWCLNPWDVTP